MKWHRAGHSLVSTVRGKLALRSSPKVLERGKKIVRGKGECLE